MIVFHAHHSLGLIDQAEQPLDVVAEKEIPIAEQCPILKILQHGNQEPGEREIGREGLAVPEVETLLAFGPEGTVVIPLGPKLIFPKLDDVERYGAGRAKRQPCDLSCFGLPAIEANING